MSGLDLDLSSAHDVVVDAARRGVPAVFAPPATATATAAAEGGDEGRDGDGHGPAGSDLPAYDDEEAWAGRTIDGAWLAAFLTSGEIHGRGITIRGARIRGGLDLQGSELPFRLAIGGCQLGEHRLVLRDGRTRTIELAGLRCGGVDAANTHIAGAFTLRRAVVTGVVSLADARIDASLQCYSTRIETTGRFAFDAAHVRVSGSMHLREGFSATSNVGMSGATVGGNLHLREGFSVTGEVRLSGTTIGGNLQATGARIDNPDDGSWPARGPGSGDPADVAHLAGAAVRFALRANGTQVAGSMFLDHGFVARGHLQMFGLRVGGDLLCTEGRFDNPVGDALSLDGAHIGGSVFLERSVVEGRVRLVNSDIGGDLRCGGARLADQAGLALAASRVTIAGNVFLDDRFTAVGEVRLPGATIGGSLRCSSARLSLPPGTQPAAVDPAAVAVDQPVAAEDLGRGEPPGTVPGPDGYVVLPPEGVALNADAAQIGAEVRLDHGFTATGQVRFTGATLGGGLDCRGAQLDGAGVASAFDMRGAKVATFVLFSAGFRARGAVRFTGATIGGDVNCRGAQIIDPGRIELHGGAPASPISLHGSGAQIGGTLFLTDGFRAEGEVRLLAISIGRDLFSVDATITAAETAVGLTRAQITGDAVLGRGVSVTGRVAMARAVIGGNLDVAGGTFSCPGDRAIDASNAQVGGAALFGEGPEQAATVEGHLHLAGATVGGSMRLGWLRVEHAGAEPAVSLVNARVAGAFMLRGTVTGGVELRGISVGGDLDCGGARLVAGDDHVALAGDRAHVTGSLLLNRGFQPQGFRAEGAVRLRSATIGGHTSCRGGRFSNPGKRALNLAGSRFAGDVVLSDGFSAEGEVRLSGATIGNDLICNGSSFSQTGDPALRVSGAHVTGSVLLSDGFSAQGEVHLSGAAIGGDLDCRRGSFSQPDDAALRTTGARVTGSVLLSDGFTAAGSVRLAGAVISGDLICTGGVFEHPSGTALRLMGAHIRGAVRLDDGFVARGRVRLSAATVDGDVFCEAGHFLNPDGEEALGASGARIAGALSLRDGFHAEGPVVLRDARVGTLADDAASWPDAIDLDGFRYDRLACPPQDRGWRARRHWLRRQTTPSAQGYVGLAAVYRAAGDELDARRILIERHNALLRPPERWRSQLPSGPRENIRRAWRWVLRLTIGHGFAPGRSLLIAAPLVVALALWLGHARQRDMLVATDDTAVTDTRGQPRASHCDDRYPCLQPLVYALDTMVPIVELGQRSRWTPDQSHRGATWLDDGRWLASATWTTSALGWVLATLVAASFTQIVRRE